MISSLKTVSNNQLCLNVLKTSTRSFSNISVINNKIKSSLNNKVTLNKINIAPKKQNLNVKNFNQIRSYVQGSEVSFKGIKNFISLKDFTPEQILWLIRNSLEIKQDIKNGKSLPQYLKGKTLGMFFTKRSTRTRVSSESGWAGYGGHPMFLGKDDIQVGAGEPWKDTSIVVSSMVDCILARLGGHEEVETLAKYSSVPVINALTAKYHPLQILADIVTIYETYLPNWRELPTNGLPLPKLPNLKVAWIGDANNILHSLLVTLPRIGISISAATPKKYTSPQDVIDFAVKNSRKNNKDYGEVSFTHDPVAAVKDCDIIITDTWISMGQESEKKQRLIDFAGFQVTEELAKKGGAKKDWKFMHCLPRKPQEVNDEVFYNPKRSIVFQEAENRKYTVMSVFEMLMVEAKKTN
ncbi:mitochondrial ornithine carbamoyltransferase [Piromyces finnis]|uniref:ornithine carbamoyltransferase n=1 Tax=Piromyces finnis TaxID=1754191 RepID=A0A1Y1VAM0_9FUNG|nr:mitochondrial ornithine carbamoyltransferase [Piromyces finnis]|eukprot:ORX51404.1 mitochondrial ornithine carbamoyltransferase [Piromyces finnis]